MNIFNKAQNRPLFWPTLFLVKILIIFLLLMNSYFPQIPANGYSSFIVAFEFAQTPAEVRSLFQNLTPDEIKRIDTGNYLDFGFMFAYSILIGFIFAKSARIFRRKWLYFGVVLSAVILLSDLAENVYLLKLSNSFLTNNYSIHVNLLNNLHLFTWLKWGTLAFVFFIFYEVLIRLNWFYKIFGLLCLIPLLFLLFCGDLTPEKISLFTGSIFGGFIVLSVFGLTYRTK